MGDRSQRTEKPTARRKREARREGKVARSQELGGWAGLLAGTYALPALLSNGVSHMAGLEGKLAFAMAHPSPAAAVASLEAGLAQLPAMLAPLLGASLAAAVVVNVAQVGPAASLRRLAPDISRASPLAGLKRLFSPTGGWELAKSVAKLAVVGTMAWRLVEGLAQRFVGAQLTETATIVSAGGRVLLSFVREVALVGMLLAVGDYLYQRRRVMGGLKMTKQEVKEELRRDMGDPQIKGALRRQRVRMSKLRMMAEVGRASVVVVNPTHFAVALRYDRGRDRAPAVVAKGTDALAHRIRARARDAGVPVVEDPPLARALHGACELGDEVPRELYRAVAQLLAFVYGLPPALAGNGVLRKPGAVAA